MKKFFSQNDLIISVMKENYENKVWHIGVICPSQSEHFSAKSSPEIQCEIQWGMLLFEVNTQNCPWPGYEHT